MKLAFYIGNHAKDTWSTRAGAAITRKVQKGPYSEFSHVECIHAVHEDGTATIASSSLRDGGVRSVRVALNPLHWRIVDVPSWDVSKSIALLELTRGMMYDLRGAIATAFIGSADSSRAFCSGWCGKPYLLASTTFGPHHLGAIALSLGKEITNEFFAEQETLMDSYWTDLGYEDD